ncbi:hypothetical protein GCM10027592_43150 [Spirosoma flavus]
MKLYLNLAACTSVWLLIKHPDVNLASESLITKKFQVEWVRQPLSSRQKAFNCFLGFTNFIRLLRVFSSYVTGSYKPENGSDENTEAIPNVVKPL